MYGILIEKNDQRVAAVLAGTQNDNESPTCCKLGIQEELWKKETRPLANLDNDFLYFKFRRYSCSC